MDPLNIVYDLARGPLVWAALIVFIVGSAIQGYRMWALTAAAKPVEHAPRPLKKDIKQQKLPLAVRIRLSVAGTSPVTIVVSTLFHLCLIITPLFVLGHNILIDNAWGISLFSFPEGFADILTLFVVACAGYFLFRRIFLERVRIITTPWDYLFLALAAGPFITGTLAYHQIFDYKLVVTLHMLCGELMLVAIPFTKFVHMLFFFVFRFAVANEYSLGDGTRTW
jgi:nitrate reductase gamma subunit